MEYTIKQIAEMSGISTRTLRYYDQIDLLKPAKLSGTGYRLYGEEEIDRLQQILLYRSLGMKLKQIQLILDDPEFNTLTALEEHQHNLEAENERINQLLATVEKTIQYTKGEITITSEEKFEGFKKERLEENERLYGEEIREKYGEETIEKSNKKWMNMNKEQFLEMQQMENELFAQLSKLAEIKDLEAPEAREVYLLHKKWITQAWKGVKDYSAEAHKGLAQMYVADERFASYYNDRAEKEVIQLLYDAIVKYTKD